MVTLYPRALSRRPIEAAEFLRLLQLRGGQRPVAEQKGLAVGVDADLVVERVEPGPRAHLAHIADEGDGRTAEIEGAPAAVDDDAGGIVAEELLAIAHPARQGGHDGLAVGEQGLRNQLERRGFDEGLVALQVDHHLDVEIPGNPGDAVGDAGPTTDMSASSLG